MSEKRPSGIKYLDQYLDGGVPAGTIVTIQTDPMAEGELLLRGLSFQKSALYISTVRSAESVQQWVQTADHTPDETSIVNPPIDSKERKRSSVKVVAIDLDHPIADLEDKISNLRTSSVIIIDSVNCLENENRSRFLQFLQSLEEAVRGAGHICYLHRLHDDSKGAQESVNQKHNREHLFQISDSVWKISSEAVDGDVNHFLHIEKNRFGPVLADPLKLELGDEISIDTSRWIS